MKYSEASDEAAYFALWREMRDLPVIARFCIDGEPVSKARARFTGYGSKIRSYTPEKTLTAEQRVREAFIKAAPDHTPDALHTYGLTALFFTGTRQRRDVDNMVKLICDGLNKVAWDDDVQVVEVSARKTMDVPEHARTEVLVYRVGTKPQLARKACELCGEKFEVYPGTSRRFCGKKCGIAGRGPGGGNKPPGRPFSPCAICGEPTKTHHQQTCSWKCGMELSSRKKQEKAAARTHCKHGHELPEVGAKRCLVCSRAVSARQRAKRAERADPQRGPHAIRIDIEEIS